MPPIRPASRLTVTFEGFHQNIPPLSVPVRVSADRTDQFRQNIGRHVVRHMYSRRPEDVQIIGHPDSPEGTVQVDSGGDSPSVAGRFSVAPGTDQDGAQAHPRVPIWVWAVAALVFLLLLF